MAGASSGGGSAQPDDLPSPDEPVRPFPVHRRTLLMGVGAAAAAGVVGLIVAGPAPPPPVATLVVWRLDPDWGYARGPHGKTRLVSRASRAAAAHRYALSAEDAELMNLHLCSVAPAVPREVRLVPFMELWESLSYAWNSPWAGVSVQILDDRSVRRRAGGSDLLELALAPATIGT